MCDDIKFVVVRDTQVGSHPRKRTANAAVCERRATISTQDDTFFFQLNVQECVEDEKKSVKTVFFSADLIHKKKKMKQQQQPHIKI